MALKKEFRWAYFLLLLIFALQVISLPTYSYDGVDNQTQNTETTFFGFNAHNDLLIANQGNNVTSLKFSSSRIFVLFEVQTVLSFRLAQFNKLTGIVIDSRHKIRLGISNYFHGSKYMSSSLFI